MTNIANRLLAIWGVGLAFVVMLCAPIAYAYAGSSNATEQLYSVLDRPRPQWDARGIHVGSFTLYPSVTTGVMHDSNIYATGTHPDADTIFTIDPGLWIKSNWSQNSFDAYVKGDIQQYAKFTSENNNNVYTGAETTLNIRRGLTAYGAVAYSSSHEQRGTGESFYDYGKLIRINAVKGQLSLTKQFNRLSLSTGLAIEDDNYSNTTLNGQVVNESYRDGTNATYSTRMGYDISPMTSVFVQYAWNDQSYHDQIYNSSGNRVVTGLSFGGTELFQGEIYGGYLNQNYDDRQFQDMSTYTYGGKLLWLVTDMTNVTLIGSREPGISSYDQGTSRMYSNIGLRVDHELLRNVVVSGSVGYEWDDFGNTGRVDKYTRAGASVSYYLNRSMALALNYKYLNFNTNGVGIQSYNRQQIGASLKLQY